MPANTDRDSNSAPPKPPNIVFFFTDDQRFDTVRALGNEHIHTPALDDLAGAGTSFTRAHIMGGTCPAVCMPSRAMLMTGRTLFHLVDSGASIPADHVLLGETLRRAGYATFGTGKWHNGTASYARSFSAGAEIFFGGMDDHWNVPATRFDPTGHYAQRRRLTVDFVTQTVVEQVCDHIHAGKHSSELFCDAAVAFLENYREDRPFFVYVSFMAPHDPRTMPPEYLAMYDPQEMPLPGNFMPEHPFDNGELRIRDELLAAFPRNPAEIRRHLAAYYAMITHADAQLGRVLSALRRRGDAGNTIVVFSGDNGLALGRHGLMGKQNLYDHSVHVPLILCGPGIPAGETRDAFVYLLDIYPTLCDLAGAPIPGSVEGKSFLPVLRDPRAAARETLFFAYRDFQRAVRDERWKLIEYLVDGRRTSQLFDLKEDPLEINNLAADPARAGNLARLRERLLAWRRETGDPCDQAASESA